MLIREYIPEDINDMITLGKMMHQEGAYKFLPYEPQKLIYLHKQFQEYNNGNAWVGIFDNKIVGMYVACVSEYFFCYEKIGTDLLLYVHPEYRSKCPSMAFRLIKKAEQWVKQKGAREFCPASSLAIANKQVAKLYEFMKYRNVGNLFKKEL
jgi:GNAT superfamily N-acetyltransferase